MEAKKNVSYQKKNVGYHFGHSVFTRFLAIKRGYQEPTNLLSTPKNWV